MIAAHQSSLQIACSLATETPTSSGRLLCEHYLLRNGRPSWQLTDIVLSSLEMMTDGNRRLCLTKCTSSSENLVVLKIWARIDISQEIWCNRAMSIIITKISEPPRYSSNWSCPRHSLLRRLTYLHACGIHVLLLTNNPKVIPSTSLSTNSDSHSTDSVPISTTTHGVSLWQCNALRTGCRYIVHATKGITSLWWVWHNRQNLT